MNQANLWFHLVRCVLIFYLELNDNFWQNIWRFHEIGPNGLPFSVLEKLFLNFNISCDQWQVFPQAKTLVKLVNSLSLFLRLWTDPLGGLLSWARPSSHDRRDWFGHYSEVWFGIYLPAYRFDILNPIHNVRPFFSCPRLIFNIRWGLCHRHITCFFCCDGQGTVLNANLIKKKIFKCCFTDTKTVNPKTESN